MGRYFPPPLEMEGEFTVWTNHLTKVFPNNLSRQDYYTITLDNQNDYLIVFYVDSAGMFRVWIFNLETGGDVYLTPEGVDEHWSAADIGSQPPLCNSMGCDYSIFSVMGKYVAHWNRAGNKLLVYKNGTLQATLETGTPYYRTYLISSHGKWIVIRNAVNQLQVWKGS